MSEPRKKLNAFERFLTLFTVVRPGEGHCIYLLVLKGFLLMCSYYMLKPVRETLILLDGSPAIASYSAALSAALLLIVIPAYSFFYRRTNRDRLTQRITVFFIANLLVFYLLGRAGIPLLGVAFYVWLSIFNLMIVAQFWAFATDIFNAKTGQRLFAVIAVGVSLGATLGSLISAKLAEIISPYEIMLAAGLVLCLPPILSNRAEKSVPAASRGDRGEHDDSASQSVLGGFAVVARDYYLALIALFIVLLNWIMTTGDFILRSWVVRHAEALAAASPSFSTGEFIGNFYGNFFALVSVFSLGIQLFLVSRIFRYFGVRIAVMIMPVILVLSYGIIGFVPVFTIIQWARTIEISTNYSLQNTTRHALFLPTKRSDKYEGKTTIDTFFWRFGDMIQAGAIYVGINYFGFAATEFAVTNVALALVMLAVSWLIGRQYSRLMRENVSTTAPKLNRSLEDVQAVPGEAIVHQLDDLSFIDTDPGDLLVYAARLADGSALPGWLRFDSDGLAFEGRVPQEFSAVLEIEVTATDIDGLSVSDSFLLRPG